MMHKCIIVKIEESKIRKLSKNRKGHPFMTSTWKGEVVRLRWTPADGAGRGQHHVDVHLRNYSSQTSPHARKLSFFNQNFVSGLNKKWKFLVNINYSNIN